MGRTDPEELAKFGPLARRWWDPAGPMRPLHKLNPLRLDYIIASACRILGRARTGRRPLEGVTVLDVGCGGGLLCEPLARLGATVTGIDPEPANVETARWHAAESGLEIAYEATTVEDLAAAGRRFDLVLAMEVVEHVPDPAAFVAALGEVTRPGGALMMATLSRTMKAWALAIVGAEYILGWLPPGTHSWKRFLRPSELASHLRNAGLRIEDITGVTYEAAYDRFATCRAVDVNYMLAAVRD
ncbi:bifunctional 2-polyprenyl-6-hydroxyphenol methylase/3-demethylubiquinol 3-O-methyltransferase UbiG [Geminicoccaceae bacterium 1502E]|nr:bifunctional 2-polyprenyl-6-hydroxyphenol methylase/3-demethylubiquinol 3-O-methyltransferase UbiG [Geminicoccaceae bacterium 1502E]